MMALLSILPTPSRMARLLARRCGSRGTTLAITTFSFLLTPQALAFDVSHADWGVVLSRYLTKEGLVRYDALRVDAKASPDHPFPRYAQALQSVSRAEFDRWPEQERMAFLINAYNALTVKLIVDNKPVTSPWKVDFFTLLDGSATSLDPIEHRLLRPVFRDLRIHAAVNCASISCPALREEPFVGKQLDAQLDEQMRRWLADPTRNQYDPEKGVLRLSKIFDWYESDFEDWGGGVRAVVKKYGPDAARSASFERGTRKIPGLRLESEPLELTTPTGESG